MLTAILPERPPRRGLAPRRARLFRGGPRRFDEPRHPLVAASEALAIHRLELGGREGMRRLTIEKCLHPRFQARELLDQAELLDPVEEVVALQEGRIGSVDQRVFSAVEEGAAALLFE